MFTSRADAERRVAAVLVAAGPERRHYGYDLSRAAKVRSGVMYPLLSRYMNRGWLADGWEEPDGTTRPRRRYYQLTELGRLELGVVSA